MVDNMPRGVKVDVKVERRPFRSEGKVKITRTYTLDFSDCTIGDILTALVTLREEDHIPENTPVRLNMVGKKATLQAVEMVDDRYAYYNAGKDHVEREK